MSEPEFNYQPFEEDIVIFGKKGKGKTTRAQWILSKISELPYWVYDFQGKFTGFGEVVHKVEDLKYGKYIFQPNLKGYATFEKFCYNIFDPQGNVKFSDLVIVWDELHQYVSKQKACPPLYSIVMSARNQGISNIFISTTPTAVPNWILTNISHVFAYKLSNKSHIEWLRDYMGEKAWLLLPPDKRDLLQDQPAIGEHSCVYRNQEAEESFIFD